MSCETGFDWMSFLPSFAVCVAFGCGMGWYSAKAKLFRQTAAALLWIILRLQRREVFFSPFDLAIIDVAITRITKEPSHVPQSAHPVS